MFEKKQKQHTYTVLSTTIIPNHVKQKHKVILNQLLEVVLLIREKYGLENEDVKGRFDTSTPESVQLILFNGLYGPDVPNVDEPNVMPISLLKEHNGDVTKDQMTLGYWSNSVITLNKKELIYLIEHLNVIPVSGISA